jgi:hypothetical protein
VHLQAHHTHHAPAGGPPRATATATAVRDSTTAATEVAPAPIAPARRFRVASHRGLHVDVGHAGSPAAAHIVVSLPARRPGGARPGAAAPAPSPPSGSTQGAAAPQSSASAPSGGGGQAQAGSGQGEGSGTSQGGPVGSAAGSGAITETVSSVGGGNTPASSEGESVGGSTPSGESSSGAQSGAGESESSSSGTQSGGVVGTVVHEVGSLLEQVLH